MIGLIHTDSNPSNQPSIHPTSGCVLSVLQLWPQLAKGDEAGRLSVSE
jgi:hypothetical protein